MTFRCAAPLRPRRAGKEGFLAFAAACPGLLAPRFTLDDVASIYDFVADGQPGLGMEEFIAALQTVAAERFPGDGACGRCE